MLQRFFVRKILSPLNTLVFRVSGGRFLGKMSGLPVLILVTTGRRSGKRRAAPLLYIEDGGAFVVIASFGGQPEHPAWYLNLEADPQATVELGEERVAVRAETTRGAERERLWALMTEGYGGYEGYRRKTTREIPVVRLHRV